MGEPIITGVFDFDKMQPACVLLQAALGGDSRVSNMFPAESWLVAPTPGMKRVTGTLSEWRAFRDELFPKGGETH